MKSIQEVAETQTVWQKHIKAWDANDLDAIMESYTEESVMILNNLKLEGTKAIRNVFANLFKLFNDGNNKIEPAVVEGEVIYIIWNFKPRSENGKSYFGTDTFVVQHGIVKYQTIASELYNKYPVTGQN
ncbi:nuclear transport factor 2 family protein [Nostoc sp.]|uniref:nuclear transport factor 2 family protein n=1 Tax=Nostoc sp. TaxID=1180 RepID=UPI002FF58B58